MAVSSMMTERTSMKDVSHTPPMGETVTNVWERGRESTDADTDE
ncbi:hypothetical protein [Halogeometricum limi]|uniref:Uncharacterized protein n=1 Tax=Halogeometricum limi TaxID=555875 RepID=A0A1I6GJ51_9EURY|nr:hypothetical protein [Halogeometricum limi]SFR42208.1 hypothetical protein SAMN04488124_1122 [Halogeometricum limi]